MDSQMYIRLSRVIEEHVIKSPTKGIKAFGFYWTRKSSELAKSLICEFTEPDGVVLDPFLGSGSSALGAASSGGNRLLVGVELNEMPLANLRFSLGVKPKSFFDDFERLEKQINELIHLYEYDLSAGNFRITKVIHSANEYKLSPTAFIGWMNGIQVRFSAEESGDSFDKLKTQYLARISEFENRESDLLEQNSRIAVKPNMYVSDVFGPLGFEALSRLKANMNGSLLFSLVIGASIHLCRLTDSKSQSQFPYWRPKQEIHEKSVYEITQKKLLEVSSILNRLPEMSRGEIIPDFNNWADNRRNSVLLVHGNVVEVLKNSVPANSVDLVVTDPPYFDQVAYSEYLKLWEFFTGFVSDLEHEIVESSRVGAGKTRSNFLEMLSAAFQEVRRTMKSGAYALIYFKDSKPKNLHDFIFCLERVGLSYVSQVHLSKPTFTYKQNSSPENTVGGDAILIFCATENETEVVEPQLNQTMESLDQLFLDLFEHYLTKNGPSSLTEALDNLLISHLYRTGYLSAIKSAGHFADVAARRFSYNSENRKWRIQNEECAEK